LSFDGIDFRYRIAPTGIAVESSGLGFTTSLRAWVDGQSAVPFVGSPKRLPTLAQDGVSLVITDDAVSHALSVLWSAGVFERSFSVAQLGVFPGLSRLSLELPMSPVVEADDSGITVAIADARIGLFAESGGSEELVVELAASALVDIELAADDDGSIEVALGIGTLTIQITEQRPLAAEILDLDSLAALAGAAIEVVLADLNRDLADLELPVIFGVELLVREASSGAGGALFTGELDSP
jgi:hypothetical protein